MAKIKKPIKKRSKKVNLDVFNAQDDDDQARKILARRGGGGHTDGKNLDQIESLEYSVDKIDAEDDEEITEDDAFNESDEERYGLFFSSTKKEKTRKKKTELDLNESESEEEQDESEEDGEYMDLSEMLDEKPKPAAKPRNGKVDLLPINEEDSEMSQDMTGISSSEGEEDDDDVELEGMVDKAYRTETEQKKRKRIQERNESFQESEFTLGNRATGRKKVALADLVSAAGEDTNFGELKKQLNVMENLDSKPLAAPLAPRIQDRFNRQAAKVEADKSVSKWSQLVKKNREAEALSFPMNEPPPVNLSSGALVGKFEPFTEMEMEINQVLEQAGLSERKQKEMEELELQKISKEELAERQAELAKMRSLMFFQEKKQKRIAKIKSKTYRKIAKKAAEKNSAELSLEELQKLDPERAKEEMDRMEFERAKERMTLKHKNTGKWAKRLLGRSNEEGSEGHKALMDQLRKGEELRRKIAGVDSDDSDGLEEERASDDDQVLQNGIDRLNSLRDDGEDIPQKGLFAMKFMQKGVQRQKYESEQAIIEAQQELEDYEKHMDSDYEEEEPVNVQSRNGRHVFTAKKSEIVEDFNEESDDSEEDTMVKAAGPVQIKGKASGIFAVESFDDIEEEEDTSFKAKVESKIPNKKQMDEVKTIDNPQPAHTFNIDTQPTEFEESNPWLAGDEAPVVKKSIQSIHKQFEKSSKVEKAIAKLAAVKDAHLKSTEDDVEDVLLIPEVQSNIKKGKKERTRGKRVTTEENPKELHILNTGELEDMSTQQIMRMAFANDNIEAEFAKEKKSISKEETGVIEEQGLPGWGTWSGPGVTAVKPKVTLIKTKEGVDLSKRQDKNLKHVIINEKRQKKAVKYMQTQVPHGFDNREQYERTIMTPLGKEWNTQGSHNKLVQPRVTTKVGAVIHPLRFASQKEREKH